MNEAWHQSLIAEKYCQLVGFVPCYLRNKWNRKFECMWTNKTTPAVKHEKPISLALFRSKRVDAPRWLFYRKRKGETQEEYFNIDCALDGNWHKIGIVY